MPEAERDLTDPEVVDAAIAAGKAEGDLAADLSLIANEALFDRDVARAENERLLETITVMKEVNTDLRTQLAAEQAKRLAVELALQNQTARAQRYIDTHRHASSMDEAEDDQFFHVDEPQHVGAMQ